MRALLDDTQSNIELDEKDIAGANAANWSSILVNTGVFDPTQGLPTHLPTYIAQDVEEAVTWAVEREYNNTEETI